MARVTGSYLAACYIFERKYRFRNDMILGFLHLSACMSEIFLLLLQELGSDANC